MTSGSNTNLITSGAEYLAPLGRFRGWSTQNKFGSNTAVGSTAEDIWSQGGLLSYLTSAETMNIASSDGNDKGTATALSGARTVKIFGLDNNYDLIDETITTDGTNDVETSNSYIRVYRLQVITAGSTGSNEGTITATASSAGTVQSSIAINKNQSQMIQYTVPNGFYALISEFTVSVQKGDQATVEAFVREQNHVFTLKRTYEIFQTTIVDRLTPHFLAPPKSDLTVRAAQVSGGATISVTASYDFYLIPEGQII